MQSEKKRKVLSREDISSVASPRVVMLCCVDEVLICECTIGDVDKIL